MYFPWAGHLPSNVEVCALCPPGRMRRIVEPPLRTMEEMVAGIQEALQAELDRPFALFGHSMGALVAFELARHLAPRHSSRMAHLFVSGCYAPHLPDPHPIHRLSDVDLIGELTRLGGMPREVLAHKELQELIMPSLRADLALVANYTAKPGAPLPCPITALISPDDPFADQNLAAPWKEHTSQSFVCEQFPGDHFFIQSAQKECLALIGNTLAHASAHAATPFA